MLRKVGRRGISRSLLRDYARKQRHGSRGIYSKRHGAPRMRRKRIHSYERRLLHNARAVEKQDICRQEGSSFYVVDKRMRRASERVDKGLFRRKSARHSGGEYRRIPRRDKEFTRKQRQKRRIRDTDTQDNDSGEERRSGGQGARGRKPERHRNADRKLYREQASGKILRNGACRAFRNEHTETDKAFPRQIRVHAVQLLSFDKGGNSEKNACRNQSDG